MNTVKVKSDVTADSSNKTIVVPKNQSWAINSILVSLASTATAGNRALQLVIQDPNGVALYAVDALAAQAASLTYRYAFLPGVGNEDHSAAHWLQCGLPKDLVLPTGYKIKVFDTAGIAPAADDMTVQIMYVPQYSSL